MAKEPIILPEPQLDGDFSIEKALNQRRSSRQFADSALSWAQIGQLAWAAQGITGAEGRYRAAPSSGALHPLFLYVLIENHAYAYEVDTHRLVFYREFLMNEIVTAALNQRFIAVAPCTFLFAANFYRTRAIYKRKAREFVCMDVGHAAQNLLLQATSMGLVSVPVGAFNRNAVKKTLMLPVKQEPLYLIPIGYPGLP